MNDDEIFDLLLADAPTPPPEHAATIHRLARRARTRRHLASLAAGAGVIGVCVTVAAFAQAHGRSGLAQPAASAPSIPVSPPASDEAQAYATAIQTLAEQVRGGGPRVPALYILDHTCVNVLDPADPTCAPQTLPASLRTQLTAALADYAPVTFLANGADVTDAQLDVINGGAVVELGPIQIDGTSALVPLSVRRGGLNGQGLTYQLTRNGPAWRITGTVGATWIS